MSGLTKMFGCWARTIQLEYVYRRFVLRSAEVGFWCCCCCCGSLSVPWRRDWTPHVSVFANCFAHFVDKTMRHTAVHTPPPIYTYIYTYTLISALVSQTTTKPKTQGNSTNARRGGASQVFSLRSVDRARTDGVGMFRIARCFGFGSTFGPGRGGVVVGGVICLWGRPGFIYIWAVRARTYLVSRRLTTVAN